MKLRGIYAFASALILSAVSCGRDGHIRKGQQFLELGDLERAIEQFSLAVNASPRDPQAHYQLALAYCRCDSAALAVKEYRILHKLSSWLADDIYLRQKIASFLGREPYRSTRLTTAPGNDAFPAISPDGQRIAFSSKRDGNTELYLMDSDGANQQRLTFNRAVDFAPAFSPDGRLLAFVSDRDGDDEIYIYNLGNAEQRRLTYHRGDDALPAFSPDGDEVFFVSDRQDRYRIMALFVSGAGSGREQGLRQLFQDQRNKIYFSQSRGRMLVQEERENQVVLFTAPPGGGEKSDLVGPPFRAGLPTALSPDGELLLFTSSRDGNDEIYLYRLVNATLVRLTVHPAQDFAFGFSADGRKIIFDSTRGGDRDIYVMHLDSLVTQEELIAALERGR